MNILEDAVNIIKDSYRDHTELGPTCTECGEMINPPDEAKIGDSYFHTWCLETVQY